MSCFTWCARKELFYREKYGCKNAVDTELVKRTTAQRLPGALLNLLVFAEHEKICIYYCPDVLLVLNHLKQGWPPSRSRSTCRSLNAWQSIAGDFMHVQGFAELQ